MRKLACLVAVCFAVLVGSAPARAAGAPPYQQARVLMLTVDSRVALLVCDEGQGSRHPQPVAACADLVRANGEPGRMRIRPQVMCTMQYQPITATATGVWDGRLVRFERTYGNECAMRVEGGAVFAF
ncbi:SSI family serine proteinase inhibitor [Nonomuraea sp. NPDC046570]|uniref:SSI family serine proteinase inhibitor n=1 Tax=Nonomuraea sp. NPDC046570 TaxID=3155255 RepID=UPI0033DB3CBF